MGFLMKKFIWSNHLVLLLMESLDKFVILGSLYTGWSNLLEYGLGDLPQLFMSLNFVVIRRIIRFSFCFIWENKSFYFYVDDTTINMKMPKGINELKLYMQKKFQIKKLGQLWFFLGIEIARSKKWISLSMEVYVGHIFRRWYVRM